MRRSARIGIVFAIALATTGLVTSPALAIQSAPPVHTVAQTVVPNTSIASQNVAQGCYQGGYLVFTNGMVMDAKGSANPASIDAFDSNGQDNQHWALCELANGYAEVVSSYRGNMMCLGVSNSDYTSGTPLTASPCNTTITGNEEWRKPANTPDSSYSGFDYLVPAGNWNLCANVQGSLGSGHLLVLYACNAQANEGIAVDSLTKVRDRLGIATDAASFLGYTDSPAATYCNKFSKYWQDGSSANCQGTGNYDTEWCADFAAYTWRFGGNVDFTYQYTTGYINGGAVSFYHYAVNKGTWHSVASGYTPKPGDVAVYGMDAGHTTAAHAAVVIGADSGGPHVINGDYSFKVQIANDQTVSSGSPLDGYASPPGL